MNWLCHLTLRHLRNSSAGPWLEHYTLFSQDFRNLEASLAPHLEAHQSCTSIQELQEHYSLKLHRNFVLSTFCRPILSTKTRGPCSEEDYSRILSRFQTALKQSVRAFIKLRSISSHATSSWAFIHNGLSSALLLSFTRQDSEPDETRQIQAELIQTLTERSEEVGQFSTAHKKALRAIQALQRLAEQDASRVQPSGSSNASQEQRFEFRLLFMVTILLIELLYSMLSMDEWLRTFDFNDFSPSESYNFIMSDQVPPDTNF
ncbi:uncharacterized protein QYS62_010762 [Fusarium acuminatum]|uniref:Uncharacterized protein n=1 Tax=Fusarium acuminatum TaxID=5515 RepID=A0ABZ2X8X2_9HYPO